MVEAGVEPVTEQTFLPLTSSGLVMDVVVLVHHQRLAGFVVRAGEADFLLALVVDGVGGDDQVHLALLDERFAVGGHGLGPFDLVRGDAQLGGDQLADFNVEADRLAVQAPGRRAAGRTWCRS
jgi:hypothetical protein